MGRTGLLAVLVVVIAVVSAALVWSAEQAPAPAAPAAPAAPVAPAAAQPAGEQPKAEGAAAPTAPAGAEAPAAEGKVKGWICTVKWGSTDAAPRDVTLKAAGNKMRAECAVWGNEKYLVDVDAKTTYGVTIRESEDGSKQMAAEKYPWFILDRMWKANVDDTTTIQRMRSRLDDLSAEERQAADAQVKALEAMKNPATLEATEETKKFGDYECVLYNLKQGEKVKGVVWVAKGLKVDARVWTMVGRVLDLSMGGLTVLGQLDSIEGGFPLRVNLEYIGFDNGVAGDRKINFWIEKVTQADLDVADIELPSNTVMSQPIR